MTERPQSNPYGGYSRKESRTVPETSDGGLGPKKTMLVLVIVVGCFAVLWPKLFYPMLVNNANSHIKPGPVDKTTGCCDVISELDVDTIKIMSELCGTIIEHEGKTPLTPKDIVSQCRKAVLETCGIDISAALQGRISLGHSAKQILEEVRSLNGSLCLKYNFGVSPWKLGVPHRVNLNLDPVNRIKQERSAHMRPGMVHPAFRERGRAIPESGGSTSARRNVPPPRIVEGRPGPIPGMRPAMGGAGHVVPPPKQSNYGFMGVLMPIYTVGFVIFFSYTIMKLVFKKKPESYIGAPIYPPCENDEQFQKEVFEPNRHYFNRPNKDTSKIGDEELDQLRKRLRETELAMERIVHQMAQAPLATHQDEIKANGSLRKEEEEQGSVTVMGMETTASCESGRKWSRPDSPVLPHRHLAPPKEPSPPPQQIFLEGALPPQSQILVADSATEAQKAPEDDSPVVLAGKMTLSVISLDSETGTEDSSNSGKRSDASDEERGRSSSNTSEEFEKINAADLEDQIDNIIEEAGNIALAEENRFSLEEELETISAHEIPGASQSINEKAEDNDILEEIKNQFNLEDDLLQALKEREPEGEVVLPVTDIIKEFLNNEENILLEASQDIEGPTAEKKENEIPLSEGMVAEPKRAEKDSQEIAETINQGQEETNKEIVESHTEEQPSADESTITASQTVSEENNIKNKADVLLQGLLVKADEPVKELADDRPDETKKEPLEFNERLASGAIDDLQQKEEASSRMVDVEEDVIEDVEYEDDSEEEDEDELRGMDGDRESSERRVNGEDSSRSRNGAGNSETAAENEISEDELVNDDEEIEEIIEYVDNTDDEGEEIIEINGNEHLHFNDNDDCRLQIRKGTV